MEKRMKPQTHHRVLRLHGFMDDLDRVTWLKGLSNIIKDDTIHQCIIMLPFISDCKKDERMFVQSSPASCVSVSVSICMRD